MLPRVTDTVLNVVKVGKLFNVCSMVIYLETGVVREGRRDSYGRFAEPGSLVRLSGFEIWKPSIMLLGLNTKLPVLKYW